MLQVVASKSPSLWLKFCLPWSLEIRRSKDKRAKLILSDATKSCFENNSKIEKPTLCSTSAAQADRPRFLTGEGCVWHYHELFWKQFKNWKTNIVQHQRGSGRPSSIFDWWRLCLTLPWVVLKKIQKLKNQHCGAPARLRQTDLDSWLVKTAKELFWKQFKYWKTNIVQNQLDLGKPTSILDWWRL